MNATQNKADALNTMHSHVNKIIPLLIAYVKNNDVKFKNDGSMFEKNRVAVRAIIEDGCPKKLRCFIEHSKHSGYSLKFDINYQVGEWSCCYVDGWVSLSNFEPLKTDYTESDFVNAINEYNLLDDEIRALKSKQARIKGEFKL